MTYLRRWNTIKSLLFIISTSRIRFCCQRIVNSTVQLMKSEYRFPGRIELGSVLGTKLLPDFDSKRLYKTSHFKSKYEKFMIKNDYISKGKLNFEESNGHIDTNATPVYDKVATTFISRNVS
ncbi:unnamed protein product [Rhizophagus irregularis]|nr:unnamed protein product [Rhizophagus irregularis]